MGAELEILNYLKDHRKELIAVICYHRGHVYKSKGEYDRAILEYNKAIEINPGFTKAYNGRGNAYQGKGQYGRSISDFNKAIEIDPRCAEAYYGRGVSYSYKGDYDNAWKDVHMVESLGLRVDSGFLKDLREASGRQR